MNLKNLRFAIDNTDRKLLHLLVKRQELVAQVAAFKQANSHTLRDPKREALILQEKK